MSEQIRNALQQLLDACCSEIDGIRYIQRPSQEAITAARAALSTPPSDTDIYRAFWEKYALGPRARPSCMVCGDVKQFVIWHAEIPSVGVCGDCAPTRPPDQGDRVASPEKAAAIDQAAKGGVRIEEYPSHIQADGQRADC